MSRFCKSSAAFVEIFGTQRIVALCSIDMEVEKMTHWYSCISGGVAVDNE